MAKEDDKRRVPRIKDRATKPYEKPKVVASDRNTAGILWQSGQPIPPPGSGGTK